MQNAKHTIIDYTYLLRAQLGSLRAGDGSQQFPSLAAPAGHVILIPGLYEHWNFLKPIGDHLYRHNYQVLVVARIGRNRRIIERESATLSAYLEERALEDTVIVGHSKGGLVGLHYLSQHPDQHRVRKVVAIAAPFSGTTIGRIARLAAVRELLPSSTMIQALQQENGARSRVVSIYPEYDNHVWHPQTSYLKGAKNIVHRAKGHHRILFDQSLLDLVLAEVQS